MNSISYDQSDISLKLAVKVFRYSLLIFFAICIFDPAGKVLGLKVWSFISVFIATIGCLVTSKQLPKLPRSLVVYLVLFISIPVISIGYYYLTNGSQPYAGFMLLKGYLLILLVPMLLVSRINFIDLLAGVLSALSILTLLIYILASLDSSTFNTLSNFGGGHSLFSLNYRDYGGGVSILRVYYYTSPMLVVPIGYYFAKACSNDTVRTKYWLLVALNTIAMFTGGTRANIVISILLPLSLLFYIYFSRYKILLTIGLILSMIPLTIVSLPIISAFFDPSEFSNSIKLGYLTDYANIFSEPITLLFGQGLGTYYFFTAKEMFHYNTELTYLELIRNFGIFAGVLMGALLIWPIFRAFISNQSIVTRTLAISYAHFLLICAINPNMFSSTGIITLSVLLATLFLQEPGAIWKWSIT